jgi:hypothetical protein
VLAWLIDKLSSCEQLIYVEEWLGMYNILVLMQIAKWPSKLRQDYLVLCILADIDKYHTRQTHPVFRHCSRISAMKAQEHKSPE